MPITIEGKLDGSGKRIAIAAARFNEYLVESLLKGALDSLRRHGVADQDITVVRVPGSFELPFTCRKLAETGGFDAVIALGVVIRGATSHYDLVCGEAASGCAAAMRDTGVPIIFGVVTTENIEQAIERSGSKAGNRGADAAVAALEMVSVIAEIGRLRR